MKPRRLSGVIRFAWFVVLGMMLAAAAWSISGQLIRWGMTPWLAWSLSLVFDLAGLICAEYARRAVERGTPAGLPRLAIFGFVSVSAVLNWHHGRTVGGLPAAYGLASISFAVELLFELHRRDVRDEQRAERGLIAERMPHIPLLGWIMYPGRSWTTLRGAVGARLDHLDPIQTGPADTRPDTVVTLTREEDLQQQLEHANDTVETVVRAAITNIKPARRRQPPPSRPAGDPGSPVDDVPALLTAAHAPIVYFIRNGTRVKIGTSQNLGRRIKTLCLRDTDVLLALHGDQRTEQEMHQRFTAHRVGTTEWFEVIGDLAEFLGEAPHDAPDASPDAPPAYQPMRLVKRDAPQVGPVPSASGSVTKTAAILAASSALPADASPADIALLLAQQGIAADTAYIRTVLSRKSHRAKPSAAETTG